MGLLQSLQSIFGKKPEAQSGNVTTTPPAQPGDATQTQPATTTPAAAPTTGQKKVLVVEDEKLLANALEMKFAHANYSVAKAENGQIGLEQVQTFKPDVIILDLMMPVMDGKTMLHKLREMPEFKMLPVVVLTNAGDVDNIRETKRYDNASAFLIKSNVTPEEIVQVVNDLIQPH
jgi:CheY-like chemotaxis protein